MDHRLERLADHRGEGRLPLLDALRHRHVRHRVPQLAQADAGQEGIDLCRLGTAVEFEDARRRDGIGDPIHHESLEAHRNAVARLLREREMWLPAWCRARAPRRFPVAERPAPRTRGSRGFPCCRPGGTGRDRHSQRAQLHLRTGLRDGAAWQARHRQGSRQGDRSRGRHGMEEAALDVTCGGTVPGGGTDRRSRVQGLDVRRTGQGNHRKSRFSMTRKSGSGFGCDTGARGARPRRPDRLEIGAAGRARERDHVADVGHAGGKAADPLEAQAEAGVRHGAVAAQVEVPPVSRRVEALSRPSALRARRAAPRAGCRR